MTRKLAWVALVLPILVVGLIAALYSSSPFEGSTRLVARLSLVASGVLVYLDMGQIKGLKSRLGLWRYLLVLLPAVLGPLFVLPYLWKRWKFIQEQSPSPRVPSDRWWIWPAIAGPAWALAMAAGFIWVALPEGSMIALPFAALAVGGFFVLMAASFASLVAFHKDAGYLRETEAEWVPKPWNWTVLGLVLSPPVAAVGYTYKRSRRHGVPWGELLFWRAA